MPCEDTKSVALNAGCSLPKQRFFAFSLCLFAKATLCDFKATNKSLSVKTIGWASGIYHVLLTDKVAGEVVGLKIVVE